MSQEEVTVEQLQEKVRQLTATKATADELAKKVAALESENLKLKETTEKERQEKESILFKTEFPEVEADLLPANLSLDQKKDYAKKLMKWKGVESKAPEKKPETSKEGSQWENAGNISPTLDAAQAATRAEQEKRRKELVGSGNTNGVMNDIMARSGDKIRQIFKLAPAK